MRRRHPARSARRSAASASGARTRSGSRGTMSAPGTVRACSTARMNPRNDGRSAPPTPSSTNGRPTSATPWHSAAAPTASTRKTCSDSRCNRRSEAASAISASTGPPLPSPGNNSAHSTPYRPGISPNVAPASRSASIARRSPA
ncbi:hypothetical protein [Thermocatellispora tengchongensis]|uniref:hypothetical protein n=1 Tax=Thermocatellispora tengchongensis TaxID=1073253 RepID=UPI00363754AF